MAGKRNNGLAAVSLRRPSSKQSAQEEAAASTPVMPVRRKKTTMKRKAETPLARKIAQQPRIAAAAEPEASEDIELEISMSEGVRGARQACSSTS